MVVPNRSQQPVMVHGCSDDHKEWRVRQTRACVRCCLTSTETVRTVRDGEPRTATPTLTQLLNSGDRVQCCLTSTETVRTVRDGEPRTATLTLTQLLNSGDRVQCCLTSSETVRTVRDGEPRTVHPDFNTAPEL